MTRLYIVLGIIIVLILIYRKLSKKSRARYCGVICQLLQKPSPPKKLKTRKKSKQEIKERIERIKKEKEKDI